VLGSRSWDSLARLGPPPVTIGDVLPIGDAADAWPLVDAVAPPRWSPPGEAVVLDVTAGPRDDRFTPEWRTVLAGQVHHVTPDSDRVGVRTTAARPLVRAVTRELPSEGVETGSLQVPPTGHPVLFLADHPVTGGYPVVAVLTPASVDRAAQLRPGDAVRFRVLD
jgi:allophanate hydrolase subunit 2